MSDKLNAKCPNNKCNSETFVVSQEKVLGANGEYNYIHCFECKTITSIIPSLNTTAMLNNIANDIAEIKEKLNIY